MTHVFLTLLLLLTACSSPPRSHKPVIYAEDIKNFPRLELLSSKWDPVTDESSVVIGEVRNTSNTPIQWVQVDVTVYDRKGDIATTGWALGKAKPLKPNQTTAFEVWITTPANYDKYRLRFSDPQGQEILFKER